MPETPPQGRSPPGPSRGLASGTDGGGRGVKAAVVDLATGELRSPRVRRPTPQPATPGAVIEVAAAVVNQLIADGHATPDMPAGCGLPGVGKDGRLKTAATIDASWVDAPAPPALLPPRAPVGPPSLLNSAGIVGAAMTGEHAARTGIASRPSGGG